MHGEPSHWLHEIFYFQNYLSPFLACVNGRGIDLETYRSTWAISAQIILYFVLLNFSKKKKLMNVENLEKFNQGKRLD
jgi:hypothetical protein